MRALIRKYPDNCRQSQQEVMLEPFPECVQADIDDYLDNYHYALCDDVPDSPVLTDEGQDKRMMLFHYTVEAYEHEENTRYRAVCDL